MTRCLSFKGKQLTVSIANNKICIFKQKLEFCTAFIYLPLWACQLPSTQSFFWWDWWCDINKSNFFILDNEICQHLEGLHICQLSEPVFSKWSMCDFIKIMLGKKIHSNGKADQWILMSREYEKFMYMASDSTANLWETATCQVMV